MAVIGKRFQDSGFQDILVESEIVATGSLNGVMSGHHYNRSIRAHKLMFEALQRLRWKAFLNNINPDKQADIMKVAMLLNKTGPSEKFKDELTNVSVSDVLDSYASFVEKERQSNPTFDFWSSYIDLVETLLLYVRATREGIWELHLSSLHSMLPWFFAYDRVNYARYLPAYISEMEKLDRTHQSVNEAFMDGQFVVQRQDRYGFSQIACDQLIEQTMNRDSKTKGGMTRITTRKGAVNRWILAHHHRAAICNCQ